MKFALERETFLEYISAVCSSLNREKKEVVEFESSVFKAVSPNLVTGTLTRKKKTMLSLIF